MAKDKINVNGLEVRYKTNDKNDYISITDMAKFKDNEMSGHLISRWLSTRYTIEIMGIWEKINNPHFNITEFGNIRNDSGSHNYVLSVSKWIERTNAIGIITSAGKYGGTYAHKDIAFEFATWLSPEFKFWIIREFERLKEQENKHLEWSAKRELAKINYHIHTDAIKQNLIVPTLTQSQITYKYASEADLLNVALFGITANEWRTGNPDKDGNIRDYANVQQLLVLANLESYNAEMIKDKIPQPDRLQKLNNMARTQLQILLQVENRLLLPDKHPIG
ncbi:MAG: KilA-N domain-containing protein [Christensenellaceae bacterium]|jgi:hypothetical protein|nr:KilA-N domain-containing protein [Christensenellaceae bacterium]